MLQLHINFFSNLQKAPLLCRTPCHLCLLHQFLVSKESVSHSESITCLSDFLNMLFHEVKVKFYLEYHPDKLKFKPQKFCTGVIANSALACFGVAQCVYACCCTPTCISVFATEMIQASPKSVLCEVLEYTSSISLLMHCNPTCEIDILP